MKLCQKCADAIRGATTNTAVWDMPRDETTINGLTIGVIWGPVVSDSECEFWAHQAYNRTRMILKAGIEDMGKEILA